MDNDLFTTCNVCKHTVACNAQAAREAARRCGHVDCPIRPSPGAMFMNHTRAGPQGLVPYDPEDYGPYY